MAGLGKGLDGLIKDKKPIGGSSIAPKESAVKGAAVMVDINKVERNKEQPRKKFDEEALEELAESIKQHGVLQPLLVQDRKDHYEIIAGERRWRASKKAGLKQVPVIIKNMTEQEIVEISLIENIQREDLDPIEEAQAYKRLKQEFNLTDDEVAEKVSKSRAAVTNSMRLLKLSPKVQQMVIDEMISTGHARALLSIEDEELQFEIAQNVFDQKLSVREVEKLVKSLGNSKDKKAAEKKEKDLEQYRIHFNKYATKISEKLGVKVDVVLKDKNKGKLEIDFYNNDDFEKLFDLLTKGE
ncbi:MAG: ParB/RepB/Spo0J family partition protein [Lachnospiraceae bacterium]|nr:ParB/RepB/Spo0J family partition protein [Lachnospiraceae bacterium]